MPNTVFLNKEGYIEQIYEGDQSEETVNRAVSKILPLVEKLKSEGKPIKIIASIEKLGKSSPDSRSVSVKALKNIQYDKVALYGGSLFMSHLANLIIRAARKKNKVRVFNERKEALEWLE